MLRRRRTQKAHNSCATFKICADFFTSRKFSIDVTIFLRSKKERVGILRYFAEAI
jgi:hypothetical protein